MKSPVEPSKAQETEALDQILSRPVTNASPAMPSRAEGIIIGQVEALDEEGKPLVRIDAWGLAQIKAGTMVVIDMAHIGQTVALGFEAGDPYRPIILGFMMGPNTQVIEEPLEVRLDQERVVLNAEQEIELRCGEAAIILNADGRVTIRGTYVTSQASATQRILGGSVNLN